MSTTRNIPTLKNMALSAVLQHGLFSSHHPFIHLSTRIASIDRALGNIPRDHIIDIQLLHAIFIGDTTTVQFIMEKAPELLLIVKPQDIANKLNLDDSPSSELIALLLSGCEQLAKKALSDETGPFLFHAIRECVENHRNALYGSLEVLSGKVIEKSMEKMRYKLL